MTKEQEQLISELESGAQSMGIQENLGFCGIWKVARIGLRLLKTFIPEPIKSIIDQVIAAGDAVCAGS